MLLIALVSLAAVLNVAAQPDVRPPSLQFKSPGSGALTCVFPSPLTDCRLRVSDQFYFNFDTILEFAGGPQSPSVALHTNIQAIYYGEGLQRGHCGVAFSVTTGIEPIALVECFGLTGNGTWTRGHGTLKAHPKIALPVSSFLPSSMTAVAGTDVSVLLRERDGGALAHCYIWSPAAGRVNLPQSGALPAGSRYRAHGVGPARGECGLTLSYVQQQDAGVWKMYVQKNSPASSVWQITVLLIQAAPVGSPVLRVRGPSTVGSLLEATCTAPPSVPPARLSWWLGDRVVRDDAGFDVAAADVGRSRPWDKMAAVQTLTHVLQAGDSGLRLECRMSHVALPSGKTVSHQLTLAVATPATTPIPTPTPSTTPRPTPSTTQRPAPSTTPRPTPRPTLTPSTTPTPATPLEVRAESPVVRTAVGHRTEIACLVNVLDATVQWRRAGLPLQTSFLVVAGHDGTRHWLVLEDTGSADLVEFTCTASKAGETGSQVVRLTDLPGTPEWAGNATHLAWRVQSVAPVIATILKIRQVGESWQEFTDLVASKQGQDSWLVASEVLPVPTGSYTAYMTVQNKHGWSAASRLISVTLDSAEDDRPVLDVDPRSGGVVEWR